MAICPQVFSPDLIVGTPFFVCTSMVAAKLGIPYVTMAPGAFIVSLLLLFRKPTSCRPDLPRLVCASFCSTDMALGSTYLTGSVPVLPMTKMCLPVQMA